MSDLSHGIVLEEQGRHEEAESCFREVLARDPDSAEAHLRLAICLRSQGSKLAPALSEADEAIRLAPEHAFAHVIRSLILSDLKRFKEAITSADAAISLDPEASNGYAAMAFAYAAKEEWSSMEEWARRGLAIDSDDGFAENLLALSLQMQGKRDAHRETVAKLLADDPNSSLAHINAGWAALQASNHRQAEEHFREALRLEADSSSARAGLLESFRARSPLYRAYLAYCFWIQKFSGKIRWVIIIGAYVAYRLLEATLSKINPILGMAVVLIWLLLIFWIWLAPGFGNFLIAMDRNARHALSGPEKRLGWAIGGTVIGGIALLLGALVSGNISFGLLGAGLLCAAMPVSLIFDNESSLGRVVFGGATLAVLGLFAVAAILQTQIVAAGEIAAGSFTLAIIGFIIAMLCTWLGNVRSLREAKPQ
ncbi:MAG: tetratricopeptide repeat protein [Verrucomicrobiota bacterium]